MPIVESRVDQIEPQRPGRIRVHEFFLDHMGVEDSNIYDVSAGYDTVQHLADQVVARDASALTNEAAQVEARVLDGDDPANITVVHITARQRLRAVALGMMRGRPHEIIRAAQWFNASVTNAQLDAAVGVQRRIKVRDRVTGLLSLKASLDADEALRDG